MNAHSNPIGTMSVRPHQKSLIDSCITLFSVCLYVAIFLSLGMACYLLHKFYTIYIVYRLFHALIQLTQNDFTPESTYLYVFPERLSPNWSTDWHLFVIGAIFIVYARYWHITRRQEERGSHIRVSFRRFWLWRKMAEYFPIRLVPSDELYTFAKEQHLEQAAELQSDDNAKSVESTDLEARQLMDGSLDTSSLLDSSGASDNLSHDYTAICNAAYQRSIAKQQVDATEIDNAHLTSSNCDASLADNTKLAAPIHLPTNRNYLVGCHPHGIFSVGAFFNFATEVTGFEKIFPNIQHFLATLKVHFSAPFYRDNIMSYGVVSASRPSLRYLLEPDICKRTGNFVVVIVGGAPEALDSEPGLYCVHLRTRHGFFKMALETGACLLPAISFGETNTFYQISNRPGSWLRRIQEWLMSYFTFSLPLIYAWGLIPFRGPITTVVGAPVTCKKIIKPQFDDINELRERYILALNQIFTKYKPIYDPNAGDLHFY